MVCGWMFLDTTGSNTNGDSMSVRLKVFLFAKWIFRKLTLIVKLGPEKPLCDSTQNLLKRLILIKNS